MRFSNTLRIECGSSGLQVCCAGCGSKLGLASDNWKKGAALVERPVNEMPGPYQTARDLLLRQFSCPNCGVLLDTELALPGEPWLEDRLSIDAER